MSARRPAAVVLGILRDAPHGVIFVERAMHLRNHAGEIGLPGGGMDPEDEGDLRKTALREMHEEIGVAPERVNLIGELPIVRAAANTYAVTPFVAVVTPGELRIDAVETVGVFTVPLETVFEELRDGHVPFAGLNIATPVLDYEGRRIWGVTGRILASFASAWNDAASALRREVEALLR